MENEVASKELHPHQQEVNGHLNNSNQAQEQLESSLRASSALNAIEKDDSTAQLGETTAHLAVNQTMPAEAYSVVKLEESDALNMKMQKMKRRMLDTCT